MSIPLLIWPTKDPDEVLDYQLDATTQLAALNDTAASASVSIAPSGTGEMTASQVTMAGSFLTVWLSGGQPARWYQVKIEITTTGGRTLEFPVVVPIDGAFAAYPITAPLTTAFGAPITWSAP